MIRIPNKTLFILCAKFRWVNRWLCNSLRNKSSILLSCWILEGIDWSKIWLPIFYRMSAKLCSKMFVIAVVTLNLKPRPSSFLLLLHHMIIRWYSTTIAILTVVLYWNWDEILVKFQHSVIWSYWITVESKVLTSVTN